MSRLASESRTRGQVPDARRPSPGLRPFSLHSARTALRALRSRAGAHAARALVTLLCLAGLVPASLGSAQSCRGGACVAVGPRLASVDSKQGPLLNLLLSTLLPGTAVNLSVVDWNGLTQGSVGLNALLERLRLNLNLSSTAEVLSTDLSVGQLVTALAQVAQADGNTAQVSALNALGTQLGALGGRIRLGDLLNIQLPSGALADIRLNVLDLLTGSLQLYNFRNVATTPTPITVDPAALGLSGLASLRVYAQVVEPPVYTCGPAGTTLHTAAIRLKLDVELTQGLSVDASTLTSLTAAVSSILPLGLRVQAGATQQNGLLKLSVYAEVAKAEGTIASIDPVSGVLTLTARPGIADLYIGQIADSVFFNRSRILSAADVTPATAANLTVNLNLATTLAPNTTLATVTVPVTVQVRSVASGTPATQTGTFSGSFPQTRTFTSGTVSIASLTTTLVNNLEISLLGGGATVSVLVPNPLLNNLNLTAITNTVISTLTTPLKTATTNVVGPVLTAVLGDVVDPLLGLLGIRVGQAVFTVLGVNSLCTVSGVVYRDVQPDGVRDPGEESGVPAVSVNLVQNGQITGTAALSGSGSYSLADVPSGQYRLIVTNSGSNPTPAPPAGWLFVNPETGARDVTVAAQPVTNQDFGLFAGARVRGVLFRDDGRDTSATVNNAAPNNAVQEGTEPGLSGVTVSLSAAGTTRTVQSAADGTYALYWPASLGTAAALTVTGSGITPTGYDQGGGTSPVLATDLSGTGVSPLALDVSAGRDLVRRFGLVGLSAFTPDGNATAFSPGTASYTHLFRPGTQGSVTLTATANGTPGATSTFFRDLNCDGSVQASERVAVTTFTVDDSWPRDPDGRLSACAIEVQVTVPKDLNAGDKDTRDVEARLTWSGSAVTDPRTVRDTTTVVVLGRATLTKTVRNLTSGGAGSSATALPQEKLEYCLTYRNDGSDLLSDLRLADDFNAPLVYVPGTLTRDGAPLTDAAGDDDGEVTGRQVRVRIPTLAPNASGQSCFTVQVP